MGADGQPQIADLFAGQSVVFRFEFVPSLPYHEAQRRHRMDRRKRCDHVIAGKFHFIAGFQAAALAGALLSLAAGTAACVLVRGRESREPG